MLSMRRSGRTANAVIRLGFDNLSGPCSLTRSAKLFLTGLGDSGAAG